MCGIIGIVSDRTNCDRGWLSVGRDAMSHRGPDDAGGWWSADGCVGLGHRRLAIVDLSSAGRQPMQDTSGELMIVFNGEIYNFADLRQKLATRGYAFHSHCDTEVILAAYREWGIGCLSYLTGMFAFALYDSRQRQLFMARDRAGEKPLYYSLVNRTLRFASELKGLMADIMLPRRIDAEALDCYLAMGFAPGERCILRGTSKLPPAHALLFSLASGQARVWRYWKPPEYTGPVVLGETEETELLDELESLLDDSVSQQMVADVQVGILLSGGLDSSLITAMAVRKSPKVRTFTIRLSGESSLDEGRHANLIARHFRTDHTELLAGESSVDVLPSLAQQFDEPIADSSVIPTYIVSQLIRRHCTVALGGDGGDETFGGYHHYNRLLWMQRNLNWIPWHLRRFARNSAGLLPVGFRGRDYLQMLEVDWKQGLPLVVSLFGRDLRRQLLSSQDDRTLVAERVWRERIPKSPHLLRRAMEMDFENYLAERVLVKLDRASMLNSVEIRAPFLDRRLLEFSFGKLPMYLMVDGARRKVLLKRLAKRILPPEFELERKQGFSIPLGAWLRTKLWQDLLHETLLNSQTSFFDPDVVRPLIEAQRKGYNNSERLFALVLFELWRRHYHMTM
jgi:asparagine synthase (glutamine-hydrolysing)